MTTTIEAGRIALDEFSIERPLGMHPADIVVWHRNSEVIETIDDSGKDYGRIMVRLCVDGQFDIVEAHLGRTSDVEALSRAITATQEVRDALTALGHDSGLGDCMASGDEGRCKLPTGHDGRHQFVYDELRNAFELGRDAERAHL